MAMTEAEKQEAIKAIEAANRAKERGALLDSARAAVADASKALAAPNDKITDADRITICNSLRTAIGHVHEAA